MTYGILSLWFITIFIPSLPKTALCGRTSSPVLGVPRAAVTSSWQDTFDGSPHTIMEGDTPEHSQSQYWWLNSGGEFWVAYGEGRTVQGRLPTSSAWRMLYATSNPVDTDNGYHPQNIFRLVTRSTWLNSEQSVVARVNDVITSDSPNRNESNGVLLFHRYQDDDTLYYLGIRVDGTAVIKKKYSGIYETISNPPTRIFSKQNNKKQNLNLIPTSTWFGLKSRVETVGEGSVHLSLWFDESNAGMWQKVAEGWDRLGATNTPIIKSGYGGLRTDFMDVSFDNYSITEF